LIVGPKLIHTEDIQDWNQTNGYFVDSQHAREVYDYRLGQTSFVASEEAIDIDITIVELPLEGLLKFFVFIDMLDNMPLKIGKMSISILSTCCHNRYL
jgi:hypothetical protein